MFVISTDVRQSGTSARDTSAARLWSSTFSRFSAFGSRFGGRSGTVVRPLRLMTIGLFLIVMVSLLFFQLPAFSPLARRWFQLLSTKVPTTSDRKTPIVTTAKAPVVDLDDPFSTTDAYKEIELQEDDDDEEPTWPESSGNSSRSCTAKERDFQSSRMYMARVWGCSPVGDTWLKIVQTVLPRARTFVDVGSNKGYSVARFYELWNPELGLSAKTLHDAILATGTTDKQLLDCGACKDCKDPPHEAMVQSPTAMMCAETSDVRKTSGSNRRHAFETCMRHLRKKYELIRVFSFDGNRQMVSGVTEARNMFISRRKFSDAGNVSSTTTGKRKKYDWIHERAWPPASVIRDLARKWTLETAAFVENYVEGETVSFYEGKGEHGKIAATTTKPLEKVVAVPTLTIDALVEREGLARIDVLKIDTEGFDAMVVRGTRNLLKRSGVIVLIFEYGAAWGKEQMGEFIETEFGKDSGYACYFEGTTAMMKLTHECWSSPLEFREWSNVWCVAERTPEGLTLARIFDSYSVAFF